MANVAINGFSRIGRAVFKLLAETPELNIVAINDLVPPKNLAYLLQYDTVYGRYSHPVRGEGNTLTVNGQSCQLLSEQNPAEPPWLGLGVDVVFECAGVFTPRDDLQKDVRAGAAGSKRNTSPTPCPGRSLRSGCGGAAERSNDVKATN